LFCELGAVPGARDLPWPDVAGRGGSGPGLGRDRNLADVHVRTGGGPRASGPWRPALYHLLERPQAGGESAGHERGRAIAAGAEEGGELQEHIRVAKRLTGIGGNWPAGPLGARDRGPGWDDSSCWPARSDGRRDARFSIGPRRSATVDGVRGVETAFFRWPPIGRLPGRQHRCGRHGDQGNTRLIGRTLLRRSNPVDGRHGHATLPSAVLGHGVGRTAGRRGGGPGAEPQTTSTKPRWAIRVPQEPVRGANGFAGRPGAPTSGPDRPP